MNRAVGLAACALASVAHAEPTVTVEDCPFSADALALALAREAVTAPTVAVQCAADGRATIRHGDGAARTIDLRDVPPELAPRVIALVAASPVDAPPPPPPPPPPPIEPTTAPGALPPTSGAALLDERVPVDAARRAALLTGTDRWRPGALGRVGLRRHGGELLWAVGAGASYGPVAATVELAGTDLSHRLGEVRARAYALALAAQLACARGRPALCVGARASVGWQTVAATATAPTAMTDEVRAVAVDGAGEVSIALPIAGVELVAAAQVGVGAGVVARVNSAEVLRLAGWHVGAAVEVRR